ncbi:TPM domain-containing protein [Candidatus Woesearchaeota archaeon]|nr:TPM domain-containing protein [Candidatus Woesearchaeota archaeon]
MHKLTFSIVIFFLVISLVNATKIPAIRSYVTDNANILSESSKISLEETLRDLEKTTGGVQYIVYIEKEYPKELSLEEYTLKIAESNKIGKKGNDNGILLYIAIDDKKYRWEVGYGVESTLNSPLLGRISREYLVPNFINGNYEEGIIKVVDISTKILQGSNDPDIVKLKNSNETNTSQTTVYSAIFLIIAIFIILRFVAIIRNSKKNLKSKNNNDSFYHGAAWGLFAGGFGRGGFGGSGGLGGFSGGGGGYGGGGSSGGW